MSATQYIEDLMKREVGAPTTPRIRGGETNYGITVATARAYGYTGPMRDLPYSTAQNIRLRVYSGRTQVS